MKNKLQHKLYTYEAAPPENAWSNIAAALDESHMTETFPSKLYNHESTPPAGIWEKISNTLSRKPEAPLLVKRVNTPYYRYAAAAVIIGLLAFTAVWLINNNTKIEQVALFDVSNIKEKDTVTDKPVEPALNQEQPVVDDQTARDDEALEASKQIIAKLDVPAKKRMMNLNPEHLTMPVEISRTMNLLSPAEKYRDICYNSINSSIHIELDKYNIADRYVMLMTTDGNLIRMAKKWENLLCCVTGEDQDELCKDQLREWRTKIAAAPVTSSSGNFLDILHLVHSLKDNLP